MLTSHSAAPLHPAADNKHPPPELRPYTCKSPFSLFNVFDDILSKTGWAFLNWNLQVRVSYIVWRMISTTQVHCPSCNLVQSFTGDTNHQISGPCSLAGLNKELVSEGKGKAQAIDFE